MVISSKNVGRIVVSNGVTSEIPAREDLDQSAKDALREIEQAQDIAIQFENAGEAPLVISDAKMKIITREQLQAAPGIKFISTGEATQFLAMPTITFVNTTNRLIRSFGLDFIGNPKVRIYLEQVTTVEPYSTYTFKAEWDGRNVVLGGVAEDVAVKVRMVEFEDRSQWKNPKLPSFLPGPYSTASPPQPPSPQSAATPPQSPTPSSTVAPAEPPSPPAAAAPPQPPVPPISVRRR